MTVNVPNLIKQMEEASHEIDQHAGMGDFASMIEDWAKAVGELNAIIEKFDGEDPEAVMVANKAVAAARAHQLYDK